ncbi:MAG: cell envelope integrity protein CreD [Myxococcales bacterium]|nr:cell envelope integrity protein CreD [Myxococcales bacterium]MDH3484879.1 cell envelope integrity protein CreD [Myxococcales bacterium]
MSRLLIIGFIWLGCTVAWSILGSSLTVRSADTSTARSEEVHGLWGAPLHQQPPQAFYTVESIEKETRTVRREGEEPVTTTIAHRVSRDVEVPLEGSDLKADLELMHRRRGLMWFATYDLDFHGAYTFRNPTDQARDVIMRLALETASRTYDGLRIVDDQGKPIPFAIIGGMAQWQQPFEGRQERGVEVSFRTRGTGSWTYAAAPGSDEARNFRLRVTTNFPNVDFPVNSVSPSKHAATEGRWTGEWRFESLITSSPMGVQMPEKLNPGPLAARITFFAPVSLLFFFFVISMLAITSKRELHPMHYFLLGCAFFAFHLLFAYSVDHLALTWSFVVSAVVSMLLVVTYVRLFVGWRFALRKVAPVQLIYLVLFSASFFWTGFTGLAITIGAILTLFAVMQLTGRLDWTETFAKRAAERRPIPS